MSNVHIRMVEDENGDLVDMIYFHHGCAPADALGWPAPERLGQVVTCGECDEIVKEAVALDPTGRYVESSLHGPDGWCGETRPHTHGLSEGIITYTT